MWWAYLVIMPSSYNKIFVFPTCEVPTTMTPSYRLRPDASLAWFVFHTNFTLHKDLFRNAFVTPLDQVQSKPRIFFLNQIWRWKNSRTFAKIIRKRNFFLSLCISFFLWKECEWWWKRLVRASVYERSSSTHCLRKQWQLWKKKDQYPRKLRLMSTFIWKSCFLVNWYSEFYDRMKQF